MDFLTPYENDEHKAIREATRRWVQAEIAPHVLEWEEANSFPVELYRSFGAQGLLGATWPTAYGGGGLDSTAGLVIGEELVRGGSVGVAMGLGSAAIGAPPIVALGSEELKQRVMPDICSGAKISCLAITEPGAGSDVAGIKTTAVRDGDHYIVNGSKTFITSGCRADWITTAVRTGEDRHAGVSLLLIDKNTPGFSVGRPLKKMGWWASDTAELHFEDCRVPVANRIGDEGAGFIAIMLNFANERLMIASTCVAIAELAYREARRYVDERVAFGRPIGRFQVTRHKLAEMATAIDATRTYVWTVAELHRRGEEVSLRAAMAKNRATDLACEVTDHAVQLLGGYGYMREYPVERWFRDARLFPIGGGTREIMNELISRRL